MFDKEMQQGACDQIGEFARKLCAGTGLGFIVLVAQNGSGDVSIVSDIEPDVAYNILDGVAEQMKDAPLDVRMAKRHPEAGAPMSCVNCKVDITEQGTPVCAICDPDLSAIMEGRAEPKSPNLCLTCYVEHCESHGQADED